MSRRLLPGTATAALVSTLALLQPVPLDAQAGGVIVGKVEPVDINTSDLEYAPVISPDGATLYFCSDRRGGHGGHDLWKATRVGASATQFSDLTNLLPPLNSDDNEGIATFSADGRTAFFTACERADGVGDCDIYVAGLLGTEMARVTNLGPAINSRYWETGPTVSPDGRILFFVSNRPGSVGGNGDADIYISVRQADGSWGAARNLGLGVNSGGREDSPFLHPNGAYLFFASDRRGGKGGLDLYVSPLTDEGWGFPINLGAPVNTRSDERSVSVTMSGDVLYFASDRRDVRNKGKLDVFAATEVALPSIATPEGFPPMPLIVAPNPAVDHVIVELGPPLAGAGEQELVVSDAEGNVVARQTIGGDSAALDLSTASEGLYVVAVGGFRTTIRIAR